MMICYRFLFSEATYFTKKDENYACRYFPAVWSWDFAYC